MKKAIPYTSLWLGVILFVLIGGGFVAATSWLLYQDVLFSFKSRPVQATVEKKFVKVSHGRHGSVHRMPCVNYHYQAGDLLVHSESSVAADTWSGLEVGGDMPVRYVVDEVMDNRIDLPAENRMVSYMSWGLSTVCLLVVGLGVYGIRYFVRQNRTQRELLARGIPCTGEVRSIDYREVGKRKTKRYYLTLAFRDSMGREIQGTTWYLKSGTENLWSVGAPIRVFFDSRDTEKFTVDLTPIGPTFSR